MGRRPSMPRKEAIPKVKRVGWLGAWLAARKCVYKPRPPSLLAHLPSLFSESSTSPTTHLASRTLMDYNL